METQPDTYVGVVAFHETTTGIGRKELPAHVNSKLDRVTDEFCILFGVFGVFGAHMLSLHGAQCNAKRDGHCVMSTILSIATCTMK